MFCVLLCAGILAEVRWGSAPAPIAAASAAAGDGLRRAARARADRGHPDRRRGAQGRGEAAPLEPYDGVSIERALAALSRYQRVLADPPAGVLLLDACRDADELPQALAAFDLAIWDLAGGRAGRPVCELLADHPAARSR